MSCGRRWPRSSPRRRSCAITSARLPDESRRAGELLVADVARLRTLVDDLMEISRFDAGAEQIAVEPIDVGRLVGSVVAARLPMATVLVPGGPAVVETDPRRLERILGNLLDNAARACGGRAGRGRGRDVAGRARHLGRRPRSGRPTGAAAPHLRALLQGRSVAACRQQWAGPRDRRGTRRAPGRVPHGRSQGRRRSPDGPPAACDRIVTCRRRGCDVAGRW